MLRCDLHLHSNASIESQEWLPRRFGCPESYATPARQYELCKARGMDLVTLTDHDTIAGGLELMGRPDFFLSEEVTARVPPRSAGDGEGCDVHVLVWNLAPADHERIQSLRGDVFALVDYLRAQGLAHGLAHPLESPNRKLDAATLERLFLLFSAFETVNGRAAEELNACARALVGGLDAGALRRLGAKHGFAPAGGPGRRACCFGGSDDHEHPRAASCFTEANVAGGAGELLAAVMAGEARAVGRGADVIDLGVAFGSTAYRFLDERASGGAGDGSPFSFIMDALAGRDGGRPTTAGRADFLAQVRRVVADVAAPGAHLDARTLASGTDAGELARAQIAVCDRLVAGALSAATDAAVDADFFGLMAALRDGAGGVKGMLPFLFAAGHLGRQVEDARRLGRGWTASPWPAPRERLAIFADTLGQVDGVSIWCKRLVEEAARDGREVWVPHSGPVSPAVRTPETARSFIEFPEVASGTLPASVYRGLRLGLPSLVRVVAWMRAAGITEVEVATPGPLGLVGLAAARLLRLPVRAVYHTEVPGLAELLTGSALLGRWAGAYVGWFYRQADRAVAFSRGAADRLVELGVPASRIDVRALAVDPTDFSPEHRRAVGELGLELPAGRPVVLSVGRLSPEKNLPLVLEAFDRAFEAGPGRARGAEPRPLLVIAGDGPERERLERLAAASARSADIRFVGTQGAGSLRQLYASASAFVFASELDTLGLVAMEAMSSGAPVLLPRGASLAGLVEHGQSAYLYVPTPEGLAAALREVLTDRELAGALGRGGRARMVEHWRRARRKEAPAAAAPA
jgi:glycosyltransferase involved in cell wall biosynthesis/predicted metal-dependent phosphoesterase TrpH